jgi:hypothetical protein
MPLIEAALAFAITMLALSLVCSSIVEVIHRTFKLREAGLKYMLEQLFDQVLVGYLKPGLEAKAKAKLGDKYIANSQYVQDGLKSFRDGFVERMRVNRSPVGVKPDPTLAVGATQDAKTPGFRLGDLWGGRHVKELSLPDFMERLGSVDVGGEIKKHGEAAGQGAADAVDAMLKDIAQKFEGFGRDAASYFEGRARMMSVAVAIALAFFAHVDAVDLFKTYLRDPNARAKATEQAEAVTAQYRAAREAAAALTLSKEAAEQGDGKAEIERLKNEIRTAVANVNSTVQQYADLGSPLGWSVQRLNDAGMLQIVWTCKDRNNGNSLGLETLWQKCSADDAGHKGQKDTQYVDVWFEVPRSPGVIFYLLLGGLLIGLGSPFWYDLVTQLTTLGRTARGQTAQAAPQQAVAARDAAQPVTPVGMFSVSSRAAELRRF